MEKSPSTRFLLFSIRLFEPPLFEGKLDRPLKLSEAIQNNQDLNTSRTSWHIGNVQRICDHTFYFRLGRQKTRSAGELHEGDFVQSDVPDYPSTICALDANLGVCAIAANTDLVKDTEYLGTVLKKILAKSEPIFGHLDIAVDPIPDPRSFVELISQAQAITRFAVWVKRPNTFDVNKDIIEPLEQMTSDLDGNKARTSITGKHLEKKQVIDASRSVASTGDGAEASIVDEEGRTRPIKLSGATASFSAVLNENLDTEMLAVVEKMRSLRLQIRHGEDERTN